jgi:hypothetical protein
LDLTFLKEVKKKKKKKKKNKEIKKEGEERLETVAKHALKLLGWKNDYT